jgi:DNA-binding transcriptional LysR family regulator
MNLRCLKTIIAVAEHATFLEAAAALGLSHSAVSLHIKTLEEELQVALVDRTRRPPVLTERGLALVERARRMMELLDEIAALGSDERLIGALKVGVVLTAMTNLLPPALAALHKAHPKLHVDIHAGLSADLAQQIRLREIDVAVTTMPAAPVEGLHSRRIADEPLFVIAPAGVAEDSDAALLGAHPFIWFNKKTWAGQQIAQHLHQRGILVRERMEVDSLEAIEALVRNGLGVSIVPQRAGAPPFASDLKAVAFGDPQRTRPLAMIERTGNPKSRLTDALLVQLRRVAGEAVNDLQR